MIQHIVSNLCRQAADGTEPMDAITAVQCGTNTSLGFVMTESEAIRLYLCPKVQSVEAVVWKFDTAKVPAA